MNKLIFLVVMAAMVCCMSSASANMLAPGGCAGLGTATCPGTVTDFGLDPGIFAATAQADTGVEAFTSFGGFSGTIDEVVAIDSITNDLDFIFQVHNDATSLEPIAQISSGFFDGFTTDVGYSSRILLLAMGVGTRFPIDDTRSFDGHIGFDFAGFFGPLLAGQTTDLLVIKTNATSFIAAPVNLQEFNNIATAEGFGPTVASAPEPSSLVLFGSGLLGLVGLLRRKLLKA